MYDPLLADQLRSTGEAVTNTLLAPLYMVGFLEDDDERPEAPRYNAEVSDGLDGFITGGQAAFYDPNPDVRPQAAQEGETAELLYGDVGLAHDLNPTLSHEQTLEAFLDGDSYLAELADVDGQRWAARQDPWDGP